VRPKLWLPAFTPGERSVPWSRPFPTHTRTELEKNHNINKAIGKKKKSCQIGELGIVSCALTLSRTAPINFQIDETRAKRHSKLSSKLPAAACSEHGLGNGAKRQGNIPYISRFPVWRHLLLGLDIRPSDGMKASLAGLEI
jgi:hypothetical protein